MMKVLVTSLCLLFWFLVEVHSQTVYLSLNGDIIRNHGYVVISDIGSTDNTALLCHTNHPATIDPVVVDVILEETGLHQMGLELVVQAVYLFQDSGGIEILW